MKQIFVLLLTLSTNLIILAGWYPDSPDFIVNNIAYSIISEEDQTVIIKGVYQDESDLIIKETVEYDGMVYTVTAIGYEGLVYCKNVEKISFPNTISSIGELAFNHCINLKTLEFPEKIDYISRKICNDYSSLQSVTLPQNVKTVREGAFMGCTSLKTIISLNPTPPSADLSSFAWNRFDPIITLYVPSESISEYKKVEPWKYCNIKPLEESGVESVVDANEGYFRVFDLKGANILNTSDKSEIDNLSPGIYIINGNKTVVK